MAFTYRKLAGFLATAPDAGEPIDYALARGVSLGYAAKMLRLLWQRGLFSRSRKQGRGPRIYRRKDHDPSA